MLLPACLPLLGRERPSTAFPGKQLERKYKGQPQKCHTNARELKESLPDDLKWEKSFLRNSVDFNRIKTTLLNLMGEPIEARVITESPFSTPFHVDVNHHHLLYRWSTVNRLYLFNTTCIATVSFRTENKINIHVKKLEKKPTTHTCALNVLIAKTVLYILWPLDFSQVALKTM